MLISGKVTLKCWQKACNDEYCFQLEVFKSNPYSNFKNYPNKVSHTVP
jgi:hypothetical protein